MDDRIVNRLAAEIKFQLQFYCMMISCGRDEEANRALQKVFGPMQRSSTIMMPIGTSPYSNYLGSLGAA
jgi:hypothetical protein